MAANERRLSFQPLHPQAFRADDLDTARRFSGERFPAPKNGSKDLKALVMTACALDPGSRFRTAQAMRNALEALDRGILSRPQKPIPDPNPKPSGKNW